MNPFRRTSWMLLAAALLSLSQTAAGDEPLLWKFSQGNKVTYAIDQKMNMAMEVMGQNITMKIDQLMKMVTAVDEVKDDGSATIKQQIQSVRVQAAGGPLGETIYDSADKTQNKGQLAATFEQSWSKMIGQDIAMAVSPSGNVSDLKLPEGAAELANPLGGGAQGGSLKELISKSMLAFPEGDIEPGKKWQSEASVDLPFGKMTTKTEYEYLGREGDVAKIKVSPKSSLEAAAGNPIKVEISEQKADGTIEFDTKQGQIKSSTMSIEMVMNLTLPGNKIKQKITQTVDMKKL